MNRLRAHLVAMNFLRRLTARVIAQTSTQIGFTLIEILIALAVSSIIAFFSMDLIFNSFRSLSKAQSFAEVQQDFSLLYRFMQERVMSDVRIYGFTGDANRPLGRYFLPAPGRCANLEACADSSSLVFAGNSTNVLKDGLQALCAVPLGSDQLALLIDGNATPPQNFDGIVNDGVITLPNGSTAPFKSGQTLTLTSLPNATLVRVATDATKVSLTGAPGTYQLGATTLSPECQQNIGSGPIDKLVRVEIAPIYLRNFLVPTALSSAEALRLIGEFPMSVRIARILSLGTIPSPANATAKATGVLECSVAADSALTCDGSPVVHVDKYSATNLYFSFTVRLDDTRPEIEIHLMNTDGATNLEACPASYCSPLKTNALGSFFAISPGESFELLDKTVFTLLKLDGLARIRFSLTSLEGKSENFNFILKAAE